MPAIPPKPAGAANSSSGISLGSADFQEQGSDFVFDPQYGEKSTFKVEGSLERLMPQAMLYRQDGFKVTLNQLPDSPQYKMTVLLPDLNDGGDVPTVRWKIDCQIEDVDIFNLPEAADEMSFFTPRARYRKLLVNAAKAGEDFPGADIAEAIFPFSRQIYNWLCEGVKAFPIRRPTLTRIRTMSWDFATPAIIQTMPDAYTTQALARDFDIPPLIAAKLPLGEDDLTPPGREWGWVEQHSGSDTLMAQTFKQEETITWIFAPWETAMFNFIA